MAKERRQYGGRYASNHFLGTAADDGDTSDSSGGDLPELTEDDVWSSSAYADPENGWSLSGPVLAEPTRTRSRDEQRHRNRVHLGGLSLALEDGSVAIRMVAHQHLPAKQGRPAAATSAPLNVPAWPRQLRDGSAGSLAEHEAGWEEDSEWMPPHEYLAREHGRRRSGAFATSVLEGVGRTLKGRDMSRVRDAVWSRTGFFG